MLLTVLLAGLTVNSNGASVVAPEPTPTATAGTSGPVAVPFLVPIGKLDTAVKTEKTVPPPAPLQVTPIDAHDPDLDLVPGTKVYLPDGTFLGAMNGHCQIIAMPPYDYVTVSMFIRAQFSPDLYCAARDRARFIQKYGHPP